MSETRDVIVTKGVTGGYGFAITGGHPAPIMISKVTPGSPSDGKLEVGDQVVELNGQSMEGVTQFKVVSMVKQARGDLSVKVHKMKTSRTDFRAAPKPKTPETTRKASLMNRVRAASGQQGQLPEPKLPPQTHAKPAKPAVSVKPTPASRPAVSSSSSPASKSNEEVPAALKTRIDSAVERVTKLALDKFGIKVDAAGGDFADKLKSVVEQLESAAEGVTANLLPRLAGVTSRLEKASGVSPGQATPVTGDVLGRLARVVARLEAATNTSSSSAPAMKRHMGPLSASGDPEEDHPSVTAFDDFMGSALLKFMEASKAIGGQVEEQSNLLMKTFICMRRLLGIVPFSQKPGPKVLPDLFTAIDQLMETTGTYYMGKEATPIGNHLRAVSEGVVTLSWLKLEKGTLSFVEEMNGAAEYYSNRVIKEFKDKDDTHVQWARAFNTLLKEHLSYIRQHHKGGLSWGNKMRSMTFWSNAIAQTAPGDEDPDRYVYKYKLGAPVAQ